MTQVFVSAGRGRREIKDCGNIEVHFDDGTILTVMPDGNHVLLATPQKHHEPIVLARMGIGVAVIRQDEP